MQTTSISIRESNIILVLNEIIMNQPISRADISQNTSLNKVSVSEIVKKLIDLNLIKEIGIGESTTLGGRKPILLVFNEDAGVAIGIDIRLQEIVYEVSDLHGKAILKDSIKTVDYYNSVKEILNTTIKKYSKLPFGVVGATLSIHGIVDNNQIIFTPYYNVVDLEQLESEYSFPIILINEANIAAYAHHHQDVEINSTIAAITLGSGIGTGIVFKKGIYKGENSSAGELGHTIVLPKGRSCPCGNQGCLEQYASETAIIKDYQLTKKDKTLTLDDLVESYNNNDADAKLIIDEVSIFLSIGIGNYIALYAPKKLYLVGLLFDKIPDIQKNIVDNTNSVFTKTTQLKKSIFSITEGACFYSISHFIKHTKF